MKDIFVKKTGDTMTGDLTFKKNDPTIIFNTPPGETDFYLTVQDNNDGTENDTLRIGKNTNPGENTFITIDSQGYLGLGTTSPAEQLHVSDNIYTEDNLYVGGTTETLANTNFTLDGDDAFIAGTLGIEGNVYTDNSFIAGSTLTLNDDFIRDSSVLNIQANNDTTNYLTYSSDLTDLTLTTTDASDLYIKPSGDNMVFQNSTD